MTAQDIEWSAQIVAWSPGRTSFVIYARFPNGEGACAQVTFEHSRCLEFPGSLDEHILAEIVRRASNEALDFLRREGRI